MQSVSQLQQFHTHPYASDQQIWVILWKNNTVAIAATVMTSKGCQNRVMDDNLCRFYNTDEKSNTNVTEVSEHSPCSTQMHSQPRPDILWVLLLSLLLCAPAVTPAKCPQQCVCDQIQLTVTCTNRNLTQVPPTVDEVWRLHGLKRDTISSHFSFIT